MARKPTSAPTTKPNKHQLRTGNHWRWGLPQFKFGVHMHARSHPTIVVVGTSTMSSKSSTRGNLNDRGQ
eukprot:6489414-Amphidinium_carterae.1